MSKGRNKKGASVHSRAAVNRYVPKKQVKHVVEEPRREKPRLLWVGDAGCHTGFATVTHNILNRLVDMGWDVVCLAVNYFGDPHDYPKLKLYPASLGGDFWGVNRLRAMLTNFKPHVVCILNDPWIIKDYMPTLNEFNDCVKVCYTPVDSPNIMPEFAQPLSDLDAVIAYTQFGANELMKSGTASPMYIAPHGIDRSIYFPMPKRQARVDLKIPEDWFIVGCVGRNQPRKRLDLAMQAFSIFAKDKPENVKFFYHGAIRDVGWDIIQLASVETFNIADRLMITDPSITPQRGVPPEILNKIYNAMDIHISTTLGEGWGLCNMEAAATRTAQIVPNWSALGEWLQSGALLVPCTGIYVNTGGINTVGGVVDVPQMVEALNKLYHDETLRLDIGNAGYQNVSQEKYTWDYIAQQFSGIFAEVAHGKFGNRQTTS